MICILKCLFFNRFSENDFVWGCCAKDKCTLTKGCLNLAKKDCSDHIGQTLQ